MGKLRKPNQKIFTHQVQKHKKENLSNREIARLYNCSPGTVGSHVKKIKQKLKLKNALRRAKRKENPIKYRIEGIIKRHREYNVKRGLPRNHNIEIDKELLEEKLKSNTTCYLTGEEIDLTNSLSYEIDHIIPLSRGGKSSNDNLALVTRQANQCKGDNTVEELFHFSKRMVTYFESKGV
jgi:CRISPR/Cas system Type II protein with McrA/HNH and RuvC-like nuclease domain